MQRAVLAVALLGLLVGSAGGCNAPEPTQWFVYTPPDGAFEIHFPTAPNDDVQTLGTVFGRLEMHVVSLAVRGEEENEDRGFIVRYGDLPARLMAGADLEVLLDGLRDGMVGTIDGALLEESPAKLGSVPGRQVRVASSTGEAQVQGRIYLSGVRAYQLMTVGAPSRAGDQESLRFFDSFQLKR